MDAGTVIYVLFLLAIWVLILGVPVAALILAYREATRTNKQVPDYFECRKCGYEMEWNRHACPQCGARRQRL